MPHNRIVLIPKYLKEFICIGASCEDNCCYGWNVDIDKNVYGRYRRISHGDIKLLLDKNIKRNRANPSEFSYAKIKMDTRGYCPFLDENKLCEIHKNLGSEYLSKVCTTYPRETNSLDGKYEKSATLSCPEIARLVLLNNRPMEFDEVEESTDAKNIIKYNLETQTLKNTKRVSKYFWDLRIFSISLIQNRKFLLWERLIILGLFIQKVSEYDKDKKIDEIPDLIQQYNEIIQSEILEQQLASIPTNLAIQMELMKKINDQRFTLKISANTSVYVRCVIEFLHGISYKKEDRVEDIAERYEEAFNCYYKPFMEKHEYILENYLVNYMFKEFFPVSSKEEVFEDYVKLVVHYSYIKMLLIGMAGFNKKLDESMIIRLIYSFSRAIDHNKVFLKSIFDLLRVNGFNNMGYMAILVKN